MTNGMPIINTVDSLSVYYGLLRTLANITDPVHFLKKMIKYGSSANEQTSHFVAKFLADTRLDEAALAEGRIVAPKNRNLVNNVIKAFNKYRIDYVFVQHDMSKETIEGKPANRRNVEQVQFDTWANNHARGFSEMNNVRKVSIVHRLEDLANSTVFDPGYERVKFDNATQLQAAVTEIRDQFRTVGIYLSPDYIKYSLLHARAAKFEATKKQLEAEGATLTFNDSANTYITQEDYEYVQIMKLKDEKQVLDQTFILTMTDLLSTSQNPFFKRIVGDKEFDTAMTGRLMDIARGNALFDETVGESSYQNAEGKTIFAHQDGTFNVKATYSLRNPAYRRQLLTQGVREVETGYKDAYDRDWLTLNYLLNNPDFEAIANQLIFSRIDGTRAVETTAKGNIITQEFRDQKEGVTYGGFSPREFITTLMNMYVGYSKKMEVSSTKSVMTTPHLIRVLEASKTGDTVNLPLNLGVYSNGSVTDKTIDIVVNDVMKEFRRIRRVQGEIGTITDNVVENYHTGTFKEDGWTVDRGYRGLQFTDNMVQVIGKNLAEQLERSARDVNGSTQLSAEQTALVRTAIRESLNNLVDGTINVMVEEGIVKRDERGHFSNQLLDRRFIVGEANLGLLAYTPGGNNNFKNNIGQVVINDYINTLAYNQILHGDPALSLKNDGGIDAVKRAKGDNAAIVPIFTMLTAPELGITREFTHSRVAIFKEPKGWSTHVKDKKGNNKEVDVADAQMYTTVEGLRYTLWGLGRLTPRVARVLDALERGDDIHRLTRKNKPGEEYDAIFDDKDGLLEHDEMTNSLKLVYKDGKTYFKMSVVVLQPTLTSYKQNGQWVARPGWETLHKLRTQMESKSIHFAAPQSASKMMTMDVSRAADFSDLKGHLYNNQYFGLQTENPSNKLEITTPTQLLQLIDTEQTDETPVFFAGRQTTVGEVRASYQNYVAQKVSNAYNIAKNEIYEIRDFNQDIEESIRRGQVVPRLAKFQKRALQTLEASGSDAQLLEFFALDENDRPKFNLNMSATKVKYQQLYLAYFSKGIMSQKNPGYTVALFSGIDTKVLKKATRIIEVDGVRKVVEWEVVRRTQWDNNYADVQNIRHYASKDEVTMEGQYFLAELEYNAPEYDVHGKVIGRFSEMMMPAHYKEFLQIGDDERLPDAITKGFGVRIPSQDKHSFMSLRIVDFLPANLGSTAMFPKELIALSGADFDIDKEFISRYDFYVDRDKRDGRPVFRKYGDARDITGKWYEYVRYMSKSNKSVKGIVNDLMAADPRVSKDARRAAHERGEHVEDVRVNRDAIKDEYIRQALRQLGLPSSLDEFRNVTDNGTIEINNGTIHNRIVDSWIALLTNEGILDIAKTPATLIKLEDVQDEEDIQYRGHSAFEKKTGFPVDSLVGKYHAYKNNTTGKDNIGIDVNANLIYSVLTKAGISLRMHKYEGHDVRGIEFDGVEYFEFGGNKEYGWVEDPNNPGQYILRPNAGSRTNDVLSTLISAATDEAKEQLNALYNLTVDALKVVDYLVALKVPLKTAIYFVNQPGVANYLRIKAANQNNLKTRDEEHIYKRDFKDKAIAQLNSQFKDYASWSNNDLLGMFEREGWVEKNCD
jgi:hypothetical protein